MKNFFYLAGFFVVVVMVITVIIGRSGVVGGVCNPGIPNHGTGASQSLD